METFAKLFGSLVVFVYHCFDRMVMLGHTAAPDATGAHRAFLSRYPHGTHPITKEALRQRPTNTIAGSTRSRASRTSRSNGPRRASGKRTTSGRRCTRWSGSSGWRVPHPEEHGSLGAQLPHQHAKFPTADPHYRLIAPQRGRYTHYYFYIRDEVLGPMLLCVGSFLPFHITYYLNGHHFIERELLRLGLRFRKEDNAFLATADPAPLQAAADRLSPTIIRQRLEHWT